MFTNEGLLEAGKVFTILEKEQEKKSIPAVGYITIEGKKYYYCAYGLFDDPDIYSEK